MVSVLMSDDEEGFRGRGAVVEDVKSTGSKPAL